MSSILEALKKLEDEKAARQSGAGHIAGKVVKSGRRAKQHPKWMLPAGMAAVAAVAVLATYILMGGISTRYGTPQPSPSVQRQPESGGTLQRPAPTAAPATIPSAAIPARRKRSLPPSPATSPAREAPVPAAATRLPQEGAAVQVKPAQPLQPAAATGLPVLQVTGIGWQKDNANRLAIVNGRPVVAGNVVEGAKVEEILPDRVRFSINDRSFEIAVGNGYGEKQ
jgi:general secretion pathway protein B